MGVEALLPRHDGARHDAGARLETLRQATRDAERDNAAASSGDRRGEAGRQRVGSAGADGEDARAGGDARLERHPGHGNQGQSWGGRHYIPNLAGRPTFKLL